MTSWACMGDTWVILGWYMGDTWIHGYVNYQPRHRANSSQEFFRIVVTVCILKWLPVANIAGMELMEKRHHPFRTDSMCCKVQEYLQYQHLPPKKNRLCGQINHCGQRSVCLIFPPNCHLGRHVGFKIRGPHHRLTYFLIHVVCFCLRQTIAVVESHNFHQNE